MDVKVLRVGLELMKETLPLQSGSRLYELQGLNSNKWYEVKISYPASIPATFTLQLSKGSSGLNVGRKLLNTEKIIFQGNNLQLLGGKGGTFVLVNVEPEGIVSIPGVKDRRHIIYNIDSRPTMALPSVTSITSQTPSQNFASLATNVNQSHLLKLDRHNYIVWKSQILLVLRGNELEGYVDGTHKCPPKLAPNSSSETTSTTSTDVVINPAHVDNLAVAAHPVSDDDLVLYILGGLGQEYNVVVVSVTTRAELISLADLRGLLLSQEYRLEQMTRIEQGLSQANLSTRQSNNTKNDNFFKKLTNVNNNQAYGGRSRRGRGRGRGRNINSSNQNQCQVCHKFGHSALVCYHRFDHAYQASFKSRMAALIAQPSTVGDSNWYPDSGATHHLTNDIQNMAVRGEYLGSDQIHIDNGTGLTISHFGNAILPTVSRPLHLSNVLLVPKSTKNLLSLAKFTSDNDVIFELHPRFCLVNDRATSKVLPHGTLEHGLYRLLAT
ncbi:putative long chain base biosynthesis protein 1-like [Capsicum annuum]|nr:putative long chain base biosynthesis protein 1-like [Capsicum annuum]